MRVIGLTGGIATGKSTVGRILRESGAPVVDADEAARVIVEPGQPALAEIVDAFGPEVLSSDGRLDRGAMRAKISRSEADRKRLESITHPRIYEHIAASLDALSAKGHPFAFVEAALMVETGSYRLYPALVVVTCSPERQLARLVARDGGTEEEARRLVAAQLPLAEKEKVATYLIRNDGSLDDLRAQTLGVLQKLR